MSRSSVGPAIVFVAMAGAVWPVGGHAQTGDTAPAEAPGAAVPSPGVYGTDAFKVDPPRDVRLPRLEVPDPGTRAKRPDKADRASLLTNTIELSDERDRRTLAREQKAWGRLSGTMCVGCGGEARGRSRVATVDPIAVLNAKPASARFAPVRQASAGPVERTVTASAAARPTAVTAATAATVAAGAVAARPVAARPVAARPVRTRPVGEGPVTVVASTQPVGQPGARSTASDAPRMITRRSARPGNVLRPRFAHRRGHRSRLTTYLGRVRYAYLRWRHQRPAHRRLNLSR